MGHILLHRLAAIDNTSGLLRVVVDTPAGSRCKYKYDEKAGLFRLSKLLPLGARFPYNFGFVPSTSGEDGDALDALVISDEPAALGCVLPVRLIGAITAQQTERNGKTSRNDRLLGVVQTEYNPPEFSSLGALGDQRLKEIEHFFVSYNQMEGRRFCPTGRLGPEEAMALVKRYGIPAEAA